MSTARALRELSRDVVRATRGHDLALYAAGVTFYAIIALVPMLLVGLWLAGLLAGEGTVRAFAGSLAGLLPAQLDATRSLAEAGTRLSPPRVLAALLPATLYGEGLVRAFDRLSAHGDRGRRPLRGRLGSARWSCSRPAHCCCSPGWPPAPASKPTSAPGSARSCSASTWPF